MLRPLFPKFFEEAEAFLSVAAANIMAIVYGYDIAPTDDCFVSISEAATGQLSLSFFPGAIAVNALPILRKLPEWFPGAGFHKFAKETRKLTRQMQEVPLEYVKKKMVRPSFSNLCRTLKISSVDLRRQEMPLRQ